MKTIMNIRTLSLAMLLALALSCSREEKIQNGDLLFVGLNSLDVEGENMTSAIAHATGDGQVNFIHTAILEVDHEGKIWIIDATIKRGVDRHPLDTMLRDFTLKDGSSPIYKVMRLKDNRNAAQYVENAKKFLGEEYDEYFMHNNGRHYCTELVYDSYIENGRPLFESSPMNFKNKDGEFPVYWVDLFHKIGTSIPQDQPGTNPQSMSKSDILQEVFCKVE